MGGEEKGARISAARNERGRGWGPRLCSIVDLLLASQGCVWPDHGPESGDSRLRCTCGGGSFELEYSPPNRVSIRLDKDDIIVVHDVEKKAGMRGSEFSAASRRGVKELEFHVTPTPV